jgi:hypothetical protein
VKGNTAQKERQSALPGHRENVSEENETQTTTSYSYQQDKKIFFLAVQGAELHLKIPLVKVENVIAS